MVDNVSQQWLDGLGIGITWQSLTWQRFKESVDNDPPLLWGIGWMADYPDPDNFLRIGLERTNYSTWHHDEYEALVQEGRRTLSHSRRMAVYERAQRILVDEAPVIPFAYTNWHRLIKPWVRNYSHSLKDVVIEPH
jgi:ABC-type oligopeptide transport system substrate-binding subunit